MTFHSTIAQQLATERQRELLDHASHLRQVRTAQAAQSVRRATVVRTRPYLISRVRAVLTSH